MCIFDDIFFSCVLLPNNVFWTRRFSQGAAQSLPRVVCPYTLSNLCQCLKTKNLVKIRLLKGNLIYKPVIMTPYIVKYVKNTI